MIESEVELRHSYESIAKMYALRDKIAADTSGYPETRQNEVESVEAMIRKIERQIAEYLASHPERVGEQTAPAV